MKEFTRFETQYILSLAIQAKRDLKEMKEADPFLGTADEMDFNISSYISTLEDIMNKAKFNMKELDKMEK